jgi:predicted RNase H-like nuclease
MILAVDIPLGLQDAAARGGRECDQLARGFIGARASSVFSPPAVGALRASTHPEAVLLNRQSGPDAPGLSIQAFAIFPKLIDADQALAQSPWLRERTIEVHPEVCFRQMSGKPLLHAKKRAAGKDKRRELLQRGGMDGLEAFEERARNAGARTDDALDACAAAWSAWRRAHGTAACFPSTATGPDYWMRIWY